MVQSLENGEKNENINSFKKSKKHLKKVEKY